MKTMMLAATGGWMLLTGVGQAADAVPPEPERQQQRDVAQTRQRQAGKGGGGDREQVRERARSEDRSQRYGSGYESRQRGASDDGMSHGGDDRRR